MVREINLCVITDNLKTTCSYLLEVSIDIQWEFYGVCVKFLAEFDLRLVASPILNSRLLADEFSHINLTHRLRGQETKEGILRQNFLVKPLVKIVTLALDDHIMHRRYIADDREL